MAAAATPRVLIVTDAADDDALLDVLAAGIADLVARQGSAWPRRIARAAPLPGAPRVLELVGARHPAPAAAGLTERQGDVLRLIAQGLSNKGIARALGVSPATVKTHVAQLIAVMGATNRTDAAMRGRERGLV